MEQIAYGEHAEQYGELRIPRHFTGDLLVVLIHGGFWRDQYTLDLMHPMAEAMCERGLATWNIEYRRVGPTGGGFPTTLDDVAAAIEHAGDRTWSSVAVIGHSAGGHLALWNASRGGDQLALTIGLAPVADVIAANREGVGHDATANFFGGNVSDVPERYTVAQPNPDAFDGRVVLIHGDNDDNVPVSQSTALVDRVDRVEVLKAVDHFQVIDPAHSSWDIVWEELADLQG